MSIYGRGKGRKGWNDWNDVLPVANDAGANDAGANGTTRTATSAQPETSSDWSAQRRASPLEYLLPSTEKWFASLPPDVAPGALATRYPRIANLICVQWNDRRGCPLLFDDLLADRRGGRQGFPPPVKVDLLKLQEYWYGGRASLPPNERGLATR